MILALDGGAMRESLDRTSRLVNLKGVDFPVSICESSWIVLNVTLA